MEQVNTYITASQWAKILAKAWQDGEFKLALQKNPREAIQSAFPGMIDEETKIFAMPPRPENLSDEELQTMENAKNFLIPGICI